MTEGSVHDGNHLVLVRAQVMTRDDSSGGWVPVGGGGLSNVVIRKRNVSSDEDAKHEYLVYGKRMLDESVVLSCIIKKDFQYNKVNPTFHHWSTGDKKFGLTFQTAADARAFDKGVRMAVEDVLDGHPESSHMLDADVGDDDVFMAIDLPVERGDSRSSSGSSSNGGGSNSGGVVVTAPTPIAMPLSTTGDPYPHANHHRMHYIPRPQQQQRGSHVANNNSGVGTVEDIWVKHNEKTQPLAIKEPKDGDKIEVLQEPYSYVQFAKARPSMHEYSYPIVEALKMERKEDSHHARPHSHLQQQHMFNQQGQSGKVCGGVPPSPHPGVTRGVQQPPLLPTKTKRHKEKKREKLKNLLLEQARCKHCHEMFCEEENERGSCEYAPDCLRSCINMVTCISCAQCMLYHCMSDSEGDFAPHSCSCDRSDDNCSRRWLGLTFLSLLVPCLWCYLPLRACHHCGVKCGIFGGRHEAT